MTELEQYLMSEIKRNNRYYDCMIRALIIAGVMIVIRHYKVEKKIEELNKKVSELKKGE